MVNFDKTLVRKGLVTCSLSSCTLSFLRYFLSVSPSKIVWGGKTRENRWKSAWALGVHQIHQIQLPKNKNVLRVAVYKIDISPQFTRKFGSQEFYANLNLGILYEALKQRCIWELRGRTEGGRGAAIGEGTF